MLYLDITFMSFQNSFQMHEAAYIYRCNEFHLVDFCKLISLLSMKQ